MEVGAAESAWFFARGGQQRGPVPAEGLRQMLASGALSAGDLVWREGMPQWVPAGRVDELAGSIPPSMVIARPIAMPVAMPMAYGGGPPGPDLGQDAGMRMLLPVGRSVWAIAAGYLGLFSVLVVPAPVCLGVSVMAIRDIRKHPDRHGMGRAVFGLVMGIVFTPLLVFMVIAVAANHR